MTHVGLSIQRHTIHYDIQEASGSQTQYKSFLYAIDTLCYNKQSANNARSRFFEGQRICLLFADM